MSPDILTADRIRHYLPAGLLPALEVYPSVPSTNTLLKEMAAAGAPHGTVVVAAAQTAGRGRRGRSFFSPDGTGLYISVLLRPDLPLAQAVRITTAAAVAAADAVEDITGRVPGIKWVNDLYLDGRKVAGILTEAAADGDRLQYAVLGIGVNVAPPPGGFPPEIAGIAGAILPAPIPDGRARLAAAFLTRFFRLAETLGAAAYMDEYRRRCFVLGKPITVLRGDEQYPAEAVGVDEDGGLIVRRPDGTREVLSSGEVSVRAETGVTLGK